MFEYKILTRKKDKGYQFIVSYKDETGKWKQRAKQGFENESKAEKAAKAYIFDLKEELEEKAKLNKDYENITFEEFSKMYLKHKKNHVEPHTLTRFKLAISKFSDLDSMRMTDIKVRDIQNIVDKMVKSDTLKASSILAYKNTVSTMFESAIKQFEVIISNPCTNVIAPKAAKPNKRALTKIEVDDLLSKIENKTHYLISLIAAYCGLRAGEILGLTWQDIDEENDLIKITKQWKKLKNGEYGMGPLKSSNSYREVTLPLKVKLELKKYKIEYSIGDEQRLFKYKDSSCIVSTLRYDYKKAGYDVSIHELRHSYASLLISKGLTHDEAAEVLGHTVEENIRTYSHLTADNKNKVKKLILKNF
ncbi:tyrosine-type recombinase/integrase [Clostridium cellulovorans]|jgi:integrase|uniref:Integrase family protein n=1 Tax=Clostridium cellulovorans (strain ATCC 35296 / DSM 3052 / OCM 3 / 743B) TaxID=573061 RepID=D9SWI1_CLOC7|nr:tyrosine-type recombinase/integrase [Clostridium cellulovorans]ADL53263.1 integrase family protein [Clostridium cellulovorans 743B]